MEVACLHGHMHEIPMSRMNPSTEVIRIIAPTHQPNHLTIGRFFRQFKRLEELHIVSLITLFYYKIFILHQKLLHNWFDCKVEIHIKSMFLNNPVMICRDFQVVVLEVMYFSCILCIQVYCNLQKKNWSSTDFSSYYKSMQLPSMSLIRTFFK